MEFIEIVFDSPMYQAELELRNSILRAPLGLALSVEDLKNEELQLHFGIVESDTLLACLVIKPIDQSQVRLRQMAVAKTHQGQGLGSLLVSQTESMLRARGFNEVLLHARQTAIGFYQHLGYSISGEIFTEIGIPHINMNKAILVQPG